MQPPLGAFWNFLGFFVVPCIDFGGRPRVVVMVAAPDCGNHRQELAGSPLSA